MKWVLKCHAVYWLCDMTLLTSPESESQVLASPARPPCRPRWHIAKGHAFVLSVSPVYKQIRILGLWKWVIGKHELTNVWLASSTVVCAEPVISWKNTEFIKNSSLNSQKLRASDTTAGLNLWGKAIPNTCGGLVDLSWFMNTRDEGKVILIWV